MISQEIEMQNQLKTEMKRKRPNLADTGWPLLTLKSQTREVIKRPKVWKKGKMMGLLRLFRD